MYKGISKVQVWSRMYVVQKENKIINMPYQSACLVGCTFKKCYDTCITCCLIQLQLNHWTFQNVGFWPVKHKGNLTKRRIGQRNSIGVLDCPIKSFLLQYRQCQETFPDLQPPYFKEKSCQMLPYAVMLHVTNFKRTTIVLLFPLKGQNAHGQRLRRMKGQRGHCSFFKGKNAP